MAIAPAVTPEEQTLAAECLTLGDIMRRMEVGRGVNENNSRGFMHIHNVLKDAIDPSDITGRRDRFIKWFGQDAAELTATLFSFLNNHLESCREAKELLPFSFESEAERSEIISILKRIKEAMDTFNEGFAIWPPPRLHQCF